MTEKPSGNSRRLITVLLAGVIVGALLTFFNVSMAALIFKGALKPFLADGISLILSGTVVLVLTTALLSSLPNVVSVPQEVPVSILAVLAADIALHMQQESDDRIYATVLGTILVSTLLTGLVFWLLGRFRLGQLVRFVPYPVIGGFLAGTGWLLLTGSIHVMTDARLGVELIEPAALIHWAPGVAYGVVILIITRTHAHFLLMPGLIIGGIVAFYLGLALTGTTPATAMINGWLLGPLPSGRLWNPAALLALKDTHWPVVFAHHGPSLAAIPLIGALALLLNATALELAMGRDADLNQELRAGGISNLLAVFAGSPGGFLSVADTTMGLRLGAHGRLLGYIVAGFSAAILIVGAEVIAFVPRAVAGGLLCYLGLSFLVEWLVDARHHLSRLDYALVWAIMVAIGLVGFLEGVAIGIMIAAVLFILNYSRVDAVRHIFTRASYPSFVARSPHEDTILQEHGDGIVMAELHGYLFFGTAHRLITQLRDRLEAHGLARIRFVLLDFRLVSGLDSSVAHSFHRLHRHLQTVDALLIFTGMTPEQEETWFRDSHSNELLDTVPTFVSLDAGLTWCEDHLLQEAVDLPIDNNVRGFSEVLLNMLPADDAALTDARRALLMDLIEQRIHAPGDVIIQAGSHPDGIAYIERGTVTVQVLSPAGEVMALRRLQSATIIGEINFYLHEGATADVVADEECILCHLSRDAIAALEAREPHLALALHRLLALDLSRKLTYTARATGIFKG